MTNEDRNHLEEQLKVYIRNVQILERQAAQVGGEQYLPLASINQLLDTRDNIRRTSARLKYLDTHPLSTSELSQNQSAPSNYVYNNLSAPTYSHFVMRSQPFNDVIDGLNQRSAVVLIHGLGGNGKTSLAREIATHCLTGRISGDPFQGIVWLSDKEQPSSLNLDIVLDEVARTLEYIGFVQLGFEEKRREVENLLRQRRVLLVIDNFETIKDMPLLDWLQRLPEPSKAIVTTREYKNEFRRSCWPVELRGMSYPEAQQFINDRLRIINFQGNVDIRDFNALFKATDGNPKAIQMSLGLIKHDARPWSEIVDNLYKVRNDLFKDLFNWAWEKLDKQAKHILMSMCLFANSANPAALMEIAGVSLQYEFDQSIEYLTDLALLDSQRAGLDSQARFLIHPLARTFATNKLRGDPKFRTEARQRWVSWYKRLVSQVGWSWDDPERLDRLDIERQTIYHVLQWTERNHKDIDTFHLANGFGFYCYVRGLWKREPIVDEIRIRAAQRLNRPIDELLAWSFHVQVLCKQGEIEKATEYIPVLKNLAEQDRANIPVDVLFHFHHANALYWMAKGDLERAQNEWSASFEHEQHMSKHIQIVNRQWIAFCFYRMGKKLQAKESFEIALHMAQDIRIQQCIIFCRMNIASIELEQGNLENASILLFESLREARQYRDRIHLALIQDLFGRLYTLIGDLVAAQAAFDEAAELFNRLGIRPIFEEGRTNPVRTYNIAIARYM